MNLKILIVDDEHRLIQELSEYLRNKGFEVFSTETPSKAFEVLAKSDIDLMILDIKLPEMDGLEVLKKVKTTYPSIEVILISGHGDMDTVITALRSGATDYLKKPFRQRDMLIAIEKTEKFVRLRKEISRLAEDNTLISRELECSIEKTFIGESPISRKLLQEALRVASFSDTPVVISGESGTGKEIIARIIHYASSRKKAKFVPVNCAAIPENLMESEFFGYKKGTFTGAISDKRGYLEAASGGSVFLDEIADMPLSLQSKLLRVLEEHKFMKLGYDREIDINLRFLCASNKDFERLIASGEFRSDLYYRLSAYKLSIPPLRERREDIEPLLNYYLQVISEKNGISCPRVPNEVIEFLYHYSFPGNVRELKNLVERALIINRSGTLRIEDFPVFHCATPKTGLIENEQKQIQEALTRANGNQSKAAQLLGISRFALIRKIRKYEM